MELSPGKWREQEEHLPYGKERERERNRERRERKERNAKAKAIPSILYFLSGNL